MLHPDLTRSNLNTLKSIFNENLEDFLGVLSEPDWDKRFASDLKSETESAFRKLRRSYESYGSSVSSVELDQLLLEERELQKAFNKSLSLYYGGLKEKTSEDQKASQPSTTKSENLDKALVVFEEKNYSIEEIENVGLRSKWYTSQEMDAFLKRVKFGDIIQFKSLLSTQWTMYMGDPSHDAKPQIIFISGDTFFNLFSSSAGKHVQLMYLEDAIQSRKMRINNEFDFKEPPSPLQNVCKKIENEVEELECAYNFFSNNDEEFVKYLRNNQKPIGFIAKSLGIASDLAITFYIGKLFRTLTMSLPIMKSLSMRAPK
eukprot:TRINITY_DN1382_c0_g1_i3.p1 TRINITY_DN1382_c0_g1~~TRINITY_DN1382_c0_g1_i3.p1  ORF type:complete len:316 (+),score=14.56 TRINITY_DN1382_c0_g1_i3:126-1073(+)